MIYFNSKRWPPDWPYADLSQGADRVWHAARLYRAGKAPRVILSGGRLPWLGERASEAVAMRQFLTDLGVPPRRRMDRGSQSQHP